MVCFFLALCMSFNAFANENKKVSNAFIENKGQILDQNNMPNNDVLFLYNANGIKVQLRKTGYSYELVNLENLPKITGGNKFDPSSEFSKTRTNISRVDIDFSGMNDSPQIITEQKSSDYLNYIVGGREISSIYSYNKVTYKNIFDRTDIEFVISANSKTPFKYNIILHPGANISNVKFLCKGASSVIRTKEGAVNLKTALGDIKEMIPFSYYLDKPDQNKEVNFKIEKNSISFEANYDNTRTFVIDPSTNRVWGTYYGDAASDYCNATGVDAANNVYITGYSASTSNIATSGTYQSSINAGLDIYLAKFNSNGVRQWGTYFGGSSYDIGYGIYVTTYGVVYICGDTNSPANIASVGAHQTIYGGGIDDAVLAKFSTNGQLLWATYYGGLQHDFAPAVTVDGSKNVILSGHTESSNGIATASAYNNAFTFGSDAFIAKFDSLGVRQWGTYYGDTGFEETWGAACDASNNIYVTGFTSSLFGVSTGTAHQTINGGGGQDAFISKFDPTGTNLIWGTYYGGTGTEQGNSIKIDNAGNVFVAGSTTSPNNISSTGAWQIALGSADDGFVARFNFSGARQWATYYGGNDVDYIYDLILDPANSNIFFCGSTESTNTMNSANAYQPGIGSINFYDAYFAEFSYGGSRKLGTYFGGSDNDFAKGIARDNTGKIYIAGTTTSTNSIASIGSHMPLAGGVDDAFLAKFCVAPEPLITPAVTATICTGYTYTLSTQSGAVAYLWNNGSVTNTTSISTATAGTYYFTVTQNDAFGCSGTSDSLKIVVDLCLQVAELENDLSVNLYPVPTGDDLNLEFKDVEKGKMIRIEIFSGDGKLIFKTESREQKFIYNTGKLSSGIYFLKAEVGENGLTKKFIVQN